MRREGTNMRILIVAPGPVSGDLLKWVVISDTTQVRVFSIEEAGSGAIDWTSTEGESMTLPEAIDEAQVIIISHPNSDVVTEVRNQSDDKILFGVFTEFPIPISSMSLDLFRKMWPEMVRALQTKLQKNS